MEYYGGNKSSLMCLNETVYFVFWASCSSPHGFSFEFACVAFSALCFHFEDNGGQKKLTPSNLNFLSFSYLFFFSHQCCSFPPPPHFYLCFLWQKWPDQRVPFSVYPATARAHRPTHTISSHLDSSLTLRQSSDRKHLSRWDPLH